MRRLKADEIAQALEDIPSDSDISGADDDSDLDETYRPRGELEESSSEDEEPPVPAVVDPPDVSEEEEELPEVDHLDIADVQDLPGPSGEAQPPHKRRRISGRKITTRVWTKDDLPEQEMPENVVTPRGVEGCRYEVDYFVKLFGQNNFTLLTEQSNLFRAQAMIRRNKNIPAFSEREIRQVLGILMYMSVVKMPNIRLYWKKSLRNSMVADVMSRDRFIEILAHLHLADNNLEPERDHPNYDRLYKVTVKLLVLVPVLCRKR